MDDREQFSAFVVQHARGLHRTAWLLTGDWQAAEDLVQTTLVTSWLHWHAVREPAARLSYVRRVLANAFLRGQRRRWTGELSLGWQPDRLDPVDAIAAIDAADPVLRAVRDLPAAQRAVVVLRYFDDLSERSTAEALGCSIGTVKSHAARALSALRELPELRDHMNEGTP